VIFKVAGASLVICSAVMWGLYMAAKDYFRLKDLREMKRAFEILRSEIEYGMNQLDQAAINISSKCASPVNAIFINFSEGINILSGVGEAWSEAVSKSAGGSYFSKEDLDMFNSLGKTLGYLDRNMQMNSINMQVDYIDFQIGRLEGTWEKSRKMYMSLGTLGGILIAVLLL